VYSREKEVIATTTETKKRRGAFYQHLLPERNSEAVKNERLRGGGRGMGWEENQNQRGKEREREREREKEREGEGDD